MVITVLLNEQHLIMYMTVFCIAKAQRWLLREEGAAAEHDAHGPAPLCGQIGRNQPFDATVWIQGRVPRSKASQNIPEPCGVVYQKKKISFQCFIHMLSFLSLIFPSAGFTPA